MEKTIGKRIAEHRRRLGLTQDQLAEKLGVTAQAVSKWENDQSCPDISALPVLAEIFGISVDELLGREAGQTVHSAEVLQDEKPHWEFTYNTSMKTNLGLAIWVLLMGVLLLVSGWKGLNWSLWGLLWSSGILIFGLVGLYPRFSFFRLGCGLVGCYFLLWNMDLPVPNLKSVALPLCLVLAGLSLLADALRKGNRPRFEFRHNGKSVGTKHSRSYTEDGTRFHYAQSFCSQQQSVVLPLLTGGDISSSFGEVVVNFSHCGQIADGCDLDVCNSFGEMTIQVPQTHRVVLKTSTFLSEASVRGKPNPDAEATIYVSGTVSFGELTVEYV